nr:hypothetical protein [Halorubrum sp. Atlit-26R]
MDNYRADHEFGNLRLIVDSAGDVVPFRTVFECGRFALRIDVNAHRNPSARLGSRPWRSWASASHGVFVPGQFGTFPEEHTQSGIRTYLGSGLPDVDAYDDLFLQREATHSWLLDTRARDG